MYDPFTNASLCPDCIEFYINGIIELSTAFLNIRNSIGSYYFTRNALIDFFTSIFYLIVAISVLHFLSLVDVRGLFEISFEHYSLLNKKAFLIAIVLVLISFLFEISFFIIIVQYYLRPAKNWQWVKYFFFERSKYYFFKDFSLFNSQLDAIYQIFLCIFLGIVFYSFVSRIGYVLSVAYQSKKVLILTLFGFPCRNKDRVNYEVILNKKIFFFKHLNFFHFNIFSCYI